MNIRSLVYHVQTDGQKRHCHGEANRYTLRFRMKTPPKPVISTIKIKTFDVTFRYLKKKITFHI